MATRRTIRKAAHTTDDTDTITSDSKVCDVIVNFVPVSQQNKFTWQSVTKCTN